MLSHIQPSALIGLVAGYAGHALALGGILAIFVVLVHAKPLSAQVIATLSVPSRATAGFMLSQNSIAVGLLGC
jgi:hypothetical protein